jgi:hypothetical protein
MKFLIQFVLIALLTYLFQLFGPWWVVFLSAGLVGFIISNKGFSSFFAGFLGGGLLWLVQAYLIDIANESLLSARISELFSLSSSMQIILVTALVGGLCGGFASLTGKFLKEAFKKEKEQHSVYS